MSLGGHYYRSREAAMSDEERAEHELRKVAAKLRRAITPKKFYRPRNPQAYRAPEKPHGKCYACRRPIAAYNGQCRECFQKAAQRNYKRKVAADKKRIKDFLIVFNQGV